MKCNKRLSHAQPGLGVLNTHSPFYDGGLRMLDVLPFRDAMKLCERKPPAQRHRAGIPTGSLSSDRAALIFAFSGSPLLRLRT